MFRYLLLVSATTLIVGCTDFCAYKGKPETDEQKVAYSIGYQMGQSAKFEGIDLDVEILRQGVTDAISGNEPLMTDDERRQARMILNKMIQQVRVKDAPQNKELADKFMQENGQKEGIKTHSSGVQYEILEAGGGKKPKKDSKVTVHYKGTLTDGTEFDSSYSRNRPTTLPLVSVIPGWQQILPEMHLGAKWRIFVPPHLAYGEIARPGIPSNSVLIFEIELLKME